MLSTLDTEPRTRGDIEAVVSAETFCKTLPVVKTDVPATARAAPPGALVSPPEYKFTLPAASIVSLVTSPFALNL